MIKITQKFLLLFLVAVLCVFAGNAGASTAELMCKTADAAPTDEWEMDVGDVDIWNDKDNLIIEIFNPINRYKMSKLAIHVFKDESEVYSILDRKDMPRPKLFDYQTNLLKEYDGVPQDSHYQEIPLDNFCSRDDLETCPPSDLYIVVYVVLQEWTGDDWVDLPEKAMAVDNDEDNVFRYYRNEEEGIISGYYFQYSLRNVD